MGFCRHPKTTQEMRANQDWEWCRPARRPHRLPSLYDDIFKFSTKTWKRYRRKQYYVRPVKEYNEFATADSPGFVSVAERGGDWVSD